MRRAGNSDQKVASSVGLWLKAAPLPPTPPVRTLHLHSCALGAWPKDENGLFRGLNACAQGLSVHQGARDQSLPTQCASYTVSALLQHAPPVPTALEYRQLLGFGERCLQCFPYVTPLPTGKWLSQTQQGLNCPIYSMVSEKKRKKPK